VAKNWNLYRVNSWMLLSFSYPSKEGALLGAYDLDGDWRELALYIEAPNGERIEQPENWRLSNPRRSSQRPGSIGREEGNNAAVTTVAFTALSASCLSVGAAAAAM
jgi:hypothetical protein